MRDDIDVLDGCGCTEIWEVMSEHRADRTDPVEPQKDLAHSFISFDGVDVPFDVVAEDPVLREIGNTPLVAHPENEQVVCKMEKYNPTISHKDRLGAGMVVALRQRGELDDGQRVVEASSGNTAGGVALAANRLGHPCTIVVRESASDAKVGFVRALGAEIITAPDVSHEADEYYQTVAKRYDREHDDAVLINQYERPLNRQVHYQWTGPELWKQIHGEGVTHVVSAMSTGGTLAGIAQYISEQTDAIEFVGVDGEDSNVHRAFDGEEPGEYDVDIEGLGQWRVTDSTDLSVIDEVWTVSDSMARSRVRHEARDNGLLLGTSSGAVLETAHEITHEDDSANVVAFIHDGAAQYFNDVEGW